MVAAQH
jgi:hypothetical protein